MTQTSSGIPKTLATERCEQLAHIMNSSVCLSNLLRNENKSMCPLFKKGDSKEPENYRSASLTNIVCKIIKNGEKSYNKSYAKEQID